MFRSTIALVTLAGFAAVPMQSAFADTFKLDKPHTQIIFAVEHMGLSKSYGKFEDYEGEFVFDEKNPEASSVTVTIETDSLEMNDDKWNDHLENEDFFNVEKFPTMTFKSTSVKVTGDKTADVTGDLTMLGVTKPVVLKTTFNRAGPRPMKEGSHAAGFSATGMIKRSDFGMNYGIPMLGDDVALIIEVEGDKITAAKVK